MSFDATIDSEVAKLLSVRALLQQKKQLEADAEINKLDLTMLTSDLASQVGAGASGPLVDGLLGYYVAVYKLTHGGMVFPEMTEKVAVDAINQHWLKSTLALIMMAFVALIFGGSVFGFIQYSGIKSNLDTAQTISNNLATRAATQTTDFQKQTEVSKTNLDTLVAKASKEIGEKLKAAVVEREKKMLDELKTQYSTARETIGGTVKTKSDLLGADVEAQLKVALAEKVKAAQERIDAITGSLSNSRDAATKILDSLRGWRQDAQKARDDTVTVYTDALNIAQANKNKLSALDALLICKRAGHKPKC